MSRIEIREERCKGCLLCTSVCPENILVQGNVINSKGYKVITCDEEKKKIVVDVDFALKYVQMEP